MGNRLNPGCCGCGECVDLNQQLWPDIYEPDTKKCFVRTRSVITTTTNWQTPDASTSVSDETVDSTDTEMLAGHWRWTGSAVINESDGSRTLVQTTIYEDRRLLITFDVSDQYSFGSTTQSGMNVIRDSSIRVMCSRYFRPGLNSPTTSSSRAYGIYADPTLPTDIAEFDAMLGSAADTKDCNAGVGGGTVLWSTSSQIPTSAKSTIAVLMYETPSVNSGVKVDDIRLAFVLNRSVGNAGVGSTYIWRRNFNRTAEWVYVTKEASIVPDSKIVTKSLIPLQLPSSSGMTTTTPNCIFKVELFKDLGSSPVFTFEWDWRDEVTRTGVIPPGIPDITVGASKIIAGHSDEAVSDNMQEFTISPPVDKYYMRVTYTGNYIMPDRLELKCV